MKKIPTAEIVRVLLLLISFAVVTELQPLTGKDIIAVSAAFIAGGVYDPAKWVRQPGA